MEKKDDNSFIIIPNSILKSDVWSKKERFSKLDAYIYLIKESRWQKSSCIIKDVRCGTNQLVCSFKELTEAWNLGNKNEVKRYLDYFENQGWITTKKFKNATLITVVKNSKCNANVTGNVTGDVTGNVTPNTTENQGVNVGDVTANVTGDVTGNVTQMLRHDTPSRAQVIFDSFTSSSRDNNNIQDNMLKVDSPLLSPQGELEELKKRIAELQSVNASLMEENKKLKDDGSSKFDFSVIDEAFTPCVKEWLEYKKARRETYKNQKSFVTMYNKLLKMSGNNPRKAQEIVTNSIGNNYSGLFDIKRSCGQQGLLFGQVLTDSQEERNRKIMNDEDWD